MGGFQLLKVEPWLVIIIDSIKTLGHEPFTKMLEFIHNSPLEVSPNSCSKPGGGGG